MIALLKSWRAAVGLAVVLALRAQGAAGAQQDGLARAVDGVAQAQAALTGRLAQLAEAGQTPLLLAVEQPDKIGRAHV